MLVSRHTSPSGGEVARQSRVGEGADLPNASAPTATLLDIPTRLRYQKRTMKRTDRTSAIAFPRA
ncbi:hypothetical protein SAMN05216456_0878 [Devosia crocina]|uniref:Uncharacterized protein n=1 Tax=Devosia crocina TaxID=429728 RepID=A0A1I7N5L8_9HYPH|nr:hypothetical protein SAMN05216456_0878 [Devosia crocina]